MTITPPTTPPTVAHDSATCQLGPDGARCFMCQFACEVEQGQTAVPERIWLTLPWYHPLRDSLRTVHETIPVGANVEYRLVGVRSIGTTIKQSAAPIRPAHDPDNCSLGPNDLPCDKCVERAREAVEQSAATIRARRTALLERATPTSPTEGAVALAEAWLCDEAWYRHLPNNAMQDAEVLALAAVIEEAVGMRLRMGRREYEHDEQERAT